MLLPGGGDVIPQVKPLPMLADTAEPVRPTLEYFRGQITVVFKKTTVVCPLMFMKTESGDHGGPQNICIKLKQWRGFQRKKLPAASPMLEFR